MLLLLSLAPPGARADDLGPADSVIPPEPGLPTISEAWTEEQAALIYAAAMTDWNDVPSALYELGMGRSWWENNLEVEVFTIPAWRPEHSSYDAFVTFVNPPSGAQTGCWIGSGTWNIVCVDDALPLPEYPLLLDSRGFLDLLFPVGWLTLGASVGGAMQWDCRDLRLASPALAVHAGAGFVTGLGAGIVGMANGPGAAIAVAAGSAAGAFATGAALGLNSGAALMVGVVAAATGVWVAVAVGAIVVGTAAAVVAGAIYVAGASPAGPSCPGCGEGVDLTRYDCFASPNTDLCNCVPKQSGSDDGADGHHGGGTTVPGGGGGGLGSSGGLEHTNYESGYDGCVEWTEFDGTAEACSGCWDEPEVIQTPDGELTGGMESYCSVCTKGSQSHMGDRICVSGTVNK